MAIDAVVAYFYVLMLSDKRVNYFFANSDMVKQHKRQKDFITMALGGPNNYDGLDMKSAHHKMPIGKMEFDATWENLEKSLKHYKVSQKNIE